MFQAILALKGTEPIHLCNCYFGILCVTNSRAGVSWYF